MTKIIPPELEINESDPFSKDLDLFERKSFGEDLINLLSRIDQNMVIFINAPWGEGKTTFCKMWCAELLLRQKAAIYFDAYANDYFEDPFVAFTANIYKFIDDKFDKSEASQKRKKEEFKRTAAKLGKGFLTLGAKAGISALTLGVLRAADLNEAAEASKDIIREVSSASSELLEKQIGEYAAKEENVKTFKESLAEIAKEIKDIQGFPLTIVIDELDRCRPDFALRLLERIKHFFDGPNVAFLLFINKEQLERYISLVYGGHNNADAHNYLQKFAHLSAELPMNRKGGHKNDYSVFCDYLFNYYSLKIPDDPNTLQETILSLCSHYQLSLREIEKVFSILSIYYASLPNGEFTYAFLVALLVTVKIKSHNLYSRITRGDIDFRTFSEEFDLKNFEKFGLDRKLRDFKSFVKEVIPKCLPPYKTNLTETDDSSFDKGLLNYGLRQEQVIPLICKRLDTFKINV